MLRLHETYKIFSSGDSYHGIAFWDSKGVRLYTAKAQGADYLASIISNISQIRIDTMAQPYSADDVKAQGQILWHPSDATAIRNHFVAQINAHSDTLIGLSLSEIADAIVNSNATKLALMATVEADRVAQVAAISASNDLAEMQAAVSKYTSGGQSDRGDTEIGQKL